jgi:hypothetical protein
MAPRPGRFPGRPGNLAPRNSQHRVVLRRRDAEQAEHLLEDTHHREGVLERHDRTRTATLGDPRNVPLVFIPWRSPVGVIAGLWAIALRVFPRFELGLTYVGRVALIGIAYEWTHHLIHGDYLPRGKTYNAIRRAHRLHHYRNEHYWFTVTTTNTADRPFGTLPKDPTAVPKSATAKNLHASGL